MIVVTHETGFARSAAHRVVLMADGRIVEDRTPDEFFADPHGDRAGTSSPRSSATERTDAGRPLAPDLD